MKRWIFILTLFLIIGVILAVLFFGRGNSEGNINTITLTIQNIKQFFNDDNKNDFENNLNSQNPGSAETENTCANSQISYSITNLQLISFCNSYSEENCIDKTISCSVNVNNLDYKVSGLFTIEFQYSAEETQERISSVRVSEIVNSRDTKIFSSQINIIGENANREITCSFLSTEVPKRENC